MVVTEERRKKDEQGEMERIRRSLQHEENRRKILEQRELQRLELGIKAELSKNNQSLAQKTMQPLTEELMRRLAIDRVRVFSSDDVGYQSGFGTKNYWSKLGFQVTGIPIGFLVRDRMVYSIYDRWSLVAKKANMTVKQLKKKLLKKYKTEELL